MQGCCRAGISIMWAAAGTKYWADENSISVETVPLHQPALGVGGRVHRGVRHAERVEHFLPEQVGIGPARGVGEREPEQVEAKIRLDGRGPRRKQNGLSCPIAASWASRVFVANGSSGGDGGRGTSHGRPEVWVTACRRACLVQARRQWRRLPVAEPSPPEGAYHPMR